MRIYYPVSNLVYMPSKSPKTATKDFKMYVSDSIASDQSEHGQKVREMLEDVAKGLNQILGPGYMGVALGGGSNAEQTVKKTPKIKKEKGVAKKPQS